MEAALRVHERLTGSWALPAALVVALTAVGGAVRLVMLHDSVFADELSTYWIVSTNGLGGVISTVHTDAEITPPLYFVLAWLTTRVDLTAELLRAPSFLAGVAAIPLVYLLGLRTVGRPAALVAAALTALSPFMIFYSTEARGYEVMVVLVMLSTLALLAALESGRARWWVAYAACSSAAIYTHYTSGFALAAQLLWVLWAHPEARRAALLANLGAVVGFLPWLSGLIADFSSPTTKILGAAEPFNLHTIRISLEHWSVGSPLLAVRMRALPGDVALALLGLGVTAAVVGVVIVRARERPRAWLAGIDRRLVLIVALALAALVGEAVFSVIGNDILATRNLAVSWPAFALMVAALLVAAGRPLRIGSVTLVLIAFGIGGVKMLETRFQRPDYNAAADFIDRHASSGDVVIDIVAVSPGPLSALDTALQRPEEVFRVGAPQERDHPFGLTDRIPPPARVTERAAAAARGGRIFVVAPHTYAAVTRAVVNRLPPGYHQVEARNYQGILTLAVLVFDHARASGDGGATGGP
jgi:4-amino-4-deoxy-L-arabinose transferase-like glycosyltransferase